MKKSENLELLARKKYLSKITGFPHVFDVWEIGKEFCVLAYGMTTYTLIRCKTELEAILELKQIIDKTIEDGGTLEAVKELKGVGLLDEENPIWKFISKPENKKIGRIPWRADSKSLDPNF